MGLGAYPSSDPKFLGMLGMHGTYEANMTMQNCDVLLAVGARFDDRVIGNPSTSPRSSARSSTSTSTRRRSPSAFASTCRSSATSRTCCRS
jgi:thiamine pyrophosphate-dependent acetolactate synthase large subunit-like protein